MSPTSSAALPLVSVITVNLDGERHLPQLFRALERQTYPRFETLLVDNGSTDGSIALVERDFPFVRILRAGRNLGFAAGNNLGMSEARGAYFALVNNDAVPEPGWLAALVAAARASPAIAGVGSKILFARPFLPVRLEVAESDAPPALAAGEDRTSVFVSERSSFRGCAYRKAVFQSGFQAPEMLDGERGRWASGRAGLLLPVESLDGAAELALRLFARPARDRCELTIRIGTTAVGRFEVEPGWHEPRVRILSGLVREQGFDVINNAATHVAEDGTVGDRGIYEPDRGQYDTPEDVEALCGCAMLLSREAVANAGGFDRDLFMYFEDTELSWRLRSRGFRLRYEPASVVRHAHAATSVEGSPLFNFLVSRNRILMLLEHAAPRIALGAWARELARLVRLLSVHRSVRNVDVRTGLKVQLSLLARTPRALLRRLRRWGRR